MKTRCKFKCTNVTAGGTDSDPNYSAEFDAVVSGSKENEEFFRWTPSGALRLSVCREANFEQGKEYYLDITPCDEAQAGA